MDEPVDESLGQQRFRTWLVSGFASLALLLSGIGLYALISYSLSRRIVLAMTGAIVGIGVTLGVTRYLNSMLYDIHANDPATIAGVAILLTLVAIVACYIPARRAMRVDPMVALRYE
jgi:ABC-type antimicrobial peptide transport system permease subunit